MDDRHRLLARHGERGLGLIEVLAAATLGLVVFVAIAGLFQVCVRLHLASGETSRATTLAMSQLETLVALPAGAEGLNPADTTASLTEGFRRRTWIVNDHPVAGARWIEVAVWKNPGRKVRLHAVLPR